MDGPMPYAASVASDEEDEAKAVALGMLLAEAQDLSDRPAREDRSVQPSTKRSRKRDAALCSNQLSGVRHEIAEIKAALDREPHSADAKKTATEILEMKKRIEFLQTKLEAHHRWMDDLQKLLVSAPLLDFALRNPDVDAQDASTSPDDEAKDDTVSVSSHADAVDVQRELPTLDAWRQDALGKNFSSILIAKHVDAAVALSQTNARKLLEEFADPACAFAVQFDTRGWSIAAHLDAMLLTFRASRVIASASAGNIAVALWKSLQYDDILRTFAPSVMDATVVYESETSCSSVVERILQIEAAGPVKTVVMIDSMEAVCRDGAQSWQIAVETCDDPCIAAFVAQTKATESAVLQPVVPMSPFASRSPSNGLDIVIAAKCSQLGPSGVLVQLAGSILHEGTALIPPKSHVDLVQYLVNMLPVYEELQLLAKA